ncbi:MAG TPA: Rieske 2Fe-2S domain-containing protein [Alphaproteobacteria bacterium]|nr:Rieske 2Fe-2S domain-containing protein [Alphaproteobacteria bacterium]
MAALSSHLAPEGRADHGGAAESRLVPLCEAADVPAGTGRKCVIPGMPPLAVFNAGGTFYVVDDTCTHGMASLSEGTLDGAIIECPWHAGAFDLRTGAPAAPPCTVALRTYAVTVRDAKVWIVGATPAPSQPAESETTDRGPSTGRSSDMTLQELTQRVRDSVGADSGLDATVKFVFPEVGIIYVDGLSKPNSVSNEDKDSTITVTVSRENFEKIIDKQLNPKLALMTGRLRLRGDIRIAMRLDRVFGLE